MSVNKFPFDQLKPEEYREWVKGTTEYGTLDFHGKDLAEAQFYNLGEKMKGVDFSEANLTKANLQNNSDMRDASFFETNLKDADLSNSNCLNAIFYGADLDGVNFLSCNISGANFQKSKNLSRTKNLEFVTFLDINKIDGLNEITIPWYDRNVSWERIKNIGKLPLFGASYLSLVLMPIVFSIIAYYNHNVTSFIDFAGEAIKTFNNTGLENAFQVWKEGVTLDGLPKDMMLFFVSSILLAIASTIYAFYCPNRIINFTREEWQYNNKEQLIYYLSHSWKKRPARLISGITYLIGGLGALMFIINKLWITALYILQNT